MFKYIIYVTTTIVRTPNIMDNLLCTSIEYFNSIKGNINEHIVLMYISILYISVSLSKKAQKNIGVNTIGAILLYLNIYIKYTNNSKYNPEYREHI